MRTDSYRASPARGYYAGRSTPRAPASDPGQSREHRSPPRFFTPRGGSRGRTSPSAIRVQPVRLFNDAQAVYHHEDQSIYYEDTEAEYQPEATNETYAVGGEEEEYQTEHHWAEDNFGHFSHQEEQPRYEEEAQDEPPYDY